MSNIPPTPEWLKPRTHYDLRKKGVAKKTTYKKIPVSQTKKKADLPGLNFLPSITNLSLKDSKHVIEIINEKGIGMLVDKKTGIKVDINEGNKSAYAHIYQFDPRTFPKDQLTVPLEYVGYWNTKKEYIEPKIKKDQFFQKDSAKQNIASFTKNKRNDGLLRVICKKIRQVRIRKGLNQQQFAHLAELSPDYISHIERGENNLTVSVFYQICEVLDIKPSAFWLEIEKELDI